MKAREYAERYKKNPNPGRLREILGDFLMEAKTIAEKRHVQNEARVFPILNELSDKWRAFAGLAGDRIRPDAFELALKSMFPDVYAIWQASKAKKSP